MKRMEKESLSFRPIKITSWLVGIINILSGFFYILFVILITFLGSTFTTQIDSFVIERAIIIAVALLVAGVFQLLLANKSEYFLVVKNEYLIFGLYTILIPFILLFGFWPLTLINSLLNFIYGLLVGFLIYKERNVVPTKKYSLN